MCKQTQKAPKLTIFPKKFTLSYESKSNFHSDNIVFFASYVQGKCVHFSKILLLKWKTSRKCISVWVCVWMCWCAPALLIQSRDVKFSGNITNYYFVSFFQIFEISLNLGVNKTNRVLYRDTFKGRKMSEINCMFLNMLELWCCK